MIIEQKRQRLHLNYEELALTCGESEPYFDSFVIKQDTSCMKHPCVIICPGGAYSGIADREAEPIAMQFVAAGFSAFILHYSVVPARFPCSLVELSYLVKHLRDGAEAYQIDSDRIAVLGFSAGGHLAASLGAYWHTPEIQDRLHIRNRENKPNALVLCYPVITGGEKTNKGSLRHLMGEPNTERDRDIFSLEKHVTSHFPKSFIWHTAADTGVAVENSLMLANALAEQRIPFELRIYPQGPHGISLANEVTWEGQSKLIVPRAQEWIGAAISFLKEVAFCE